MPTAAEIRQQFLDFFEEKAHRVVPSAPVVPADDPTLLFTNAGMNQFKDVFLGTGTREYTRAADTQKCIRVSGKHNDLEEVGVDTYHHTFFEMLGNWSFGDYFKEEAIAWAWELLVERFGIDGDKMYATVFGGDEKLGLPADEEAEALWPEHSGIPKERVLRFGHKDNFWEMGEVGPCGPCTEIHYDRGPEACDRKGVPGHVCQVNGDCARYIEIWNLVFIQFNRTETDLKPLPAKHVDTGMGLERLVALLQGKISNYDTDLFMPLIEAIGDLTGHTYGADERTDVALRVIADHARALSSAIADGALPGKQGRNYVIRRLLRRAARFGRQVLGTEGAFLYKLVPVVADIFEGVFPEIRQRLPHITHVIEDEERAFLRTIDDGIAAFEKVAAAVRAKGGSVVPGEAAYRLYHQDGFPRDLIELMAREQGFTLDEEGWAKAEAAHREASKGEATGHRVDLAALEGLPKTEFLGYWERGEAEGQGTVATGLKPIKLIGTEALVLDRTPFYAEAGGQVGDAGEIVAEDGGAGFCFRVEDTGRIGDVTVHFGELERGDTTKLPATVTARVDDERRRAIMANHTATHLLHWALKKTVGEHANQQGSLVAPDYLRFDFTHPKALTDDEIVRIERLVNERIVENAPVSMAEDTLDAARARGVTALFGEKYGDVVRVVEVGDFSQELCGGTHCRATGDIGYFRVASETAVQAGVRRIFAKTRAGAVEDAIAERALLHETAKRLSTAPAELLRRVEALQEQVKQLKKKGAAAAQQDVGGLRQRLLAEAPRVGGARLVIARVDVADRKALGELADALRGGDDAVAGALAAVIDGKTAFLGFATKDLVKGKGVKAGDIVRGVAESIGQRGGGRPDFAQTGWKGDEGIDAALAKARELFDAALS